MGVSYTDVVSRPKPQDRHNLKPILATNEKGTESKESDTESNNMAPLRSVPCTTIESHLRHCGYTASPIDGIWQPQSKHSPPSTNISDSSNSNAPMRDNSQSSELDSSTSTSISCTVLDAYLDNVMANIPQLALCLQDKGLIRGIKMVNTDDIPSLTVNDIDINLDSSDSPATTSSPSTNTSATSTSNNTFSLFSPEVVDLNASMLLRFLKTNCTSENSTYLLRRNPGETDIRLYDITALSRARQMKWVWWLAMMSYRFALRLDQLIRSSSQAPEYGNAASANDANVDPSMQNCSHFDSMTRRNFRVRQRGLLTTALDLLRELADMDGGSRVLLEKAYKKGGYSFFKSGCDFGDTEYISMINFSKGNIEIEALSLQLYGLHHKLINISLRLAEQHLQNYFSSSAMQALRSAGRRIADAANILRPLGLSSKDTDQKRNNRQRTKNDYMNGKSGPFRRFPESFVDSLRHQYAWLWEHCGHFARSFAADDLWRERGHACGDDVISLLREVDASCRGVNEVVGGFLSDSFDSNLSGSVGKALNFVQPFSHRMEDEDEYCGDASMNVNNNLDASPITVKTYGSVTLHKLSGLVPMKEFPTSAMKVGIRKSMEESEAMKVAHSLLDNQRQLKKDERRVLVASAICYSCASGVLETILNEEREVEEREEGSASARRLSYDGCEESEDVSKMCISSVDSSILSLLHQRLGDACNEIGKIHLAEVKKILSNVHVPQQVKNSRIALSPLLLSSKFWFMESLNWFGKCRDLQNIALIRCNLCQCSKISANTNVDIPNDDEDTPDESVKKGSRSEICLQNAIDHLDLAHEALESRDAVDQRTWDMVSEELAATYLILGVRRRQALVGGGSSPIIQHGLRLNPGKERLITEPMEKAIGIYTSLGNGHQAAAAHYQLGLLYSKVWTCQRDEIKTREKLSAAFNHFGAANRFFMSNLRGNEPTFVILSLDLSNLYSAVSGEAECVYKALLCCFDTCDAFSIDAVRHTRQEGSKKYKDWEDQMKTLGASVEERVLKLLLNLIKIKKEGSSVMLHSGKSGIHVDINLSKLKDLYRIALATKTASSKQICSDDVEYDARLSSLHDLLKKLNTLKSVNGSTG
eukprot:CAMPEP_0184872402 /NCGR_PEP_ID=MMETSP0580-20130426/41271_1 /TAXON_ID=1118495 /ORGANISM="Dactyliosolen fragilissimus" /LENGTH=1102 /DNA_ID=CAMNT_0027375199 /DNA_START=1193 /DNA_END=4501 /DNA_ORIENTATION=+